MRGRGKPLSSGGGWFWQSVYRKLIYFKRQLPSRALRFQPSVLTALSCWNGEQLLTERLRQLVCSCGTVKHV